MEKTDAILNCAHSGVYIHTLVSPSWEDVFMCGTCMKAWHAKDLAEANERNAGAAAKPAAEKSISNAKSITRQGRNVTTPPASKNVSNTGTENEEAQKELDDTVARYNPD